MLNVSQAEPNGGTARLPDGLLHRSPTPVRGGSVGGVSV
jgi:hypothetical protein